MTTIVNLPRNDRWLFSVDIFRTPDGRTVARLTDMRSSEIKSDEQPGHALLRLANLLREASDGMEAEAMLIGVATEPHREGTSLTSGSLDTEHE